jgi:uncharacterized protein YwgA
MAASAQGQAYFGDKIADAILANLIKSYKEANDNALGRTVLQKLSYFAKAAGAPLPFRFEMYHYGPFSQEIFYRTEDLLADGVILDRSSDRERSDFVPGPNLTVFLERFSEVLGQYKSSLKRVATMFTSLDPSQLELVSTIHYIHSSHREWFKRAPTKDRVVASVEQIRGNRFSREVVHRAYEVLREAALLS